MASAAAVVYTLLLFRTFVVKFLVGCETLSQRKLGHICPKPDSCRSALKSSLHCVASREGCRRVQPLKLVGTSIHHLLLVSVGPLRLLSMKPQGREQWNKSLVRNVTLLWKA